jgi:hypothetical protein
MRKTVIGILAYIVLALAFPFLVVYYAIERFLPQPDFGNSSFISENQQLGSKPKHQAGSKVNGNTNTDLVSLMLARWRHQGLSSHK